MSQQDRRDGTSALGSFGYPLEHDGRDEWERLNQQLFEAWNLGQNTFLAWTQAGSERHFLAVRYYDILEPLVHQDPAIGATSIPEFINNILAGPKYIDVEAFDHLRHAFAGAARVIRTVLPPGSILGTDLISELVTRYGVSLVRERAVMLLDIVGFSLHTPLEQVVMLNSLSYSVNSAYRQLASKNVRVRFNLPSFARTTTGDGFYIWNRDRTLEGNIALYKLMMLLLADNALSHKQAVRFPVPVLRAAFHVGEHYEFFQIEALSPTAFSYIVGHVTIELARIVDKALPGQILLGDFNISWRNARSPGVLAYDTPAFIEKAGAALGRLHGLEVANAQVENIRCHLTGERIPGGGFDIGRYAIRDKHGITRTVYNAKINIHLNQGQPIFLGLQSTDLRSPAIGGPHWPSAD